MRLPTAVGLLLLALAAGSGIRLLESPPARAELPPEGGFAFELRYVGRDPLTGMPVPVDDRLIAQIEYELERYGKDAGEAEPPPPPSGTDVTTLSIPAIGIDRALVGRYGLDVYGRLDVPQDNYTVGWNPGYTALPGTGAATFFAAHFEYAGRPGVFNRLSKLVAGDEVVVGLNDGSSHSYRVTSSIDYTIAAIDMGAVLFGREGTESITLMTCSGPPGPDGFPLRTVVLAELVS